MAKLKTEFSNFHNLIKIGQEVVALREKRDKLEEDMRDFFSSECERFGIFINASDLRFIHQGSYKIGTTISNPNGSIDLDYAVIFPLDIMTNGDPRKLKIAAKNALEIDKIRIPLIKEPCVTVKYCKKEEEYMHIDFPLYAEYKSQLYLARGKEYSSDFKWEPADPEGLNKYFIDKFSSQEQMRRIVRFIKKWKLEKYNDSTNKNEIPPSIALSILVCENCVFCKDDNNDYDLKSFYETLKNIKNKFSITKDIYGDVVTADINCRLPVLPYSDVLRKMRTSNSHLVLLYNRLLKAVENLENAVNLESEHEAAKFVQKVLGEDFEVPEKNVESANTSSKREHGFG